MPDQTSPQEERMPLPPGGKPGLEACPFCGGEASADGVARFSKRHGAWWADGTRVLEAFYVNCMICGANNQGIVGGHQTREIAIEKWNRRVVASSSPTEAAAPVVTRGCPQYIEEHGYCALPDGHAGDCQLGARVLCARCGTLAGVSSGSGPTGAGVGVEEACRFLTQSQPGHVALTIPELRGILGLVDWESRKSHQPTADHWTQIGTKIRAILGEG